MRQRGVFRKKIAPPPAKSLLVIAMIMFVIIVTLSIWIIDKGIRPTLMEVAEVKTTEFATRAINAAVKFAENYEFEEIRTVTKNEEGDITSLGWNSSVVSKINRVATDRVEAFFRSMNRGEPPNYDDLDQEPENYSDKAKDLVQKDPTVVEIPLGQATDNTILANLGPKIPVNLELVGNVKTDVIDEIQEVGINGVLITLYVIVEADVQIVIPFTTDVTTVKTKIYIDKRLVMGVVPEFYGGDSNNPSISIPKDSLKDE